MKVLSINHGFAVQSIGYTSNIMQTRILEVDYLRAYALLLVLFRHTHYSLPTIITRYPLILQGTWGGMDLFFVLSGFVITLTIMPSLELYLKGRLSLKQYLGSFFLRRIFRLLPIALIALTLNVILTYAFNASGQFGKFNEVIKEVVPILFYYYNYYIWIGGSANMSWYWSLSIEEQFYFIYPFLLILISKPKSRLIIFFLIVASITFFVRPLTTPSFESVEFKLWPKFTTPSHLRFDALFVGCILGLIFLKHGNTINNFVKTNLTITRFFAIVALFGVATFGIILPKFELTGYPSIILCSAILILIASSESKIIPTFGMNKIFTWIGKRSYSIYLFHMISIHLVNEILFRSTGLNKNQLTWTVGFVGFFCAMSLTAILAELFYFLIESKGIKLGHKISNRILEKRISVS